MKRGTVGRLLVGDVVRLQPHPDGGTTIEAVDPRRSVLKRRSPGKSRGVRPIAANVDQVIVVGAADHPRWDAHLLDRFLVVAEANHLTAIVVVNKTDLVADATVLAAPYRTAGYEVIFTSVPRGDGVEELRAKLVERVSLFSGATGVGKSSLLNAVQPGLRLRTGEVSKRSRAGRHTTTAAEMHPLRAGGFVVDTPGLRDVGLWGIDLAELAAAFPEFAAYAPCCRFDNCRHMEEPGCAVAAAEGAEVDPGRLKSYRRFVEEVARAARHWE